MDKQIWTAILLVFVLPGCVTSSSGVGTLGEAAADTEVSSAAQINTVATTSLSATAASPMSERSQWQVTVVRVVDGDTFEVRFPDGHTENVRLLGVDTPEVHVENDPAEFEGVPNDRDGNSWLRDWGHKASEFARTEIGGEEVTIRTDARADRRGSYGRLLVYLYADDDESLNRKLIAHGYARMYDSEFSKRSVFSSVEAAARQNDVGLWSYKAGASAPATVSTPTVTPVSPPESASEAEIDVPPLPADGDYDCGHFSTYEQAQYIYEQNVGDPHRLDADNDGSACESLA